ncbi:hypothetical protein DFH09DRAFT_1121806, partial [Mycena vulgaris]
TTPTAKANDFYDPTAHANDLDGESQRTPSLPLYPGCSPRSNPSPIHRPSKAAPVQPGVPSTVHYADPCPVQTSVSVPNLFLRTTAPRRCLCPNGRLSSAPGSRPRHPRSYNQDLLVRPSGRHRVPRAPHPGAPRSGLSLSLSFFFSLPLSLSLF